MNDTTILVSDYTRFPGPRYKKDGPNSGEDFREELLMPALKRVIAEGGVVRVILDGVAGYGSSFTEEAFGGLLRHGMEYDDIIKHLEIVALTDRFKHHMARATMYLAEERERQQNKQ